MQPIEVVVTENKKVSCDGDKSSSKHPLVYLNMGKEDGIVCPYCSKYFTTKKTDLGHFGDHNTHNTHN